MASQKKNEIQITETLTLCANGCGFYGNPATNNLCQSCFQSQIRSPKSGPGAAKSRSDPIALPEKDSPPAAEERKEVEAVTAPPPKTANRCAGCGKKVGLTGFRCRCGDLFCGAHRYSDRHVCSYDYRAAGKAEIERENPVVRAAKIVRI